MAEYISRSYMRKMAMLEPRYTMQSRYDSDIMLKLIAEAPAADVAPVRHGKLYSAHEVAGILAEVIGDKCACNVNGNDEWLPEKCELLDFCPDPAGVACWEQWLKWKDGGADNGTN